MSPKFIGKVPSGRTILLAITGTILLGSSLLYLTIAQHAPLSFIDTLFTATSAVCVTGLLTIPLTSFTLFGKCIILFLIQLGGLGLVTMSVFVVSIFAQVGYGTQILTGQLLELESWKNIKKLLFFIISVTVFIELIGTLAVFACIQAPENLQLQYLFYALFHAVSSFCNAGISIFEPNFAIYTQTHTYLICITMLLVFFGGIGFLVIYDLYNYTIARIKNQRAHLSLSTKIILPVTLFLFLFASSMYWILERDNVFRQLSPLMATLQASFLAISTKSSGFLTISPQNLHVATLFFVLIMAFIGSSPGSTGSGIKVTTFAIFLATVITAISGRNSVEIRGRRVPRDQVLKSLAIIALAIAWIIASTFLLLITERGWEFFDVFFEVISAFTTLGVSTGITKHLTIFGKLFIIITMIIGRIGPLTVVIALRRQKHVREYEYPEERVMLG